MNWLKNKKESAKYFQHTFHSGLLTAWVDRQPACKHYVFIHLFHDTFYSAREKSITYMCTNKSVRIMKCHNDFNRKITIHSQTYNFLIFKNWTLVASGRLYHFFRLSNMNHIIHLRSQLFCFSLHKASVSWWTMYFQNQFLVTLRNHRLHSPEEGRSLSFRLIQVQHTSGI